MLVCTWPPIGVHSYRMKRSELERKLKDLGWRFARSGGRHDIWSHAVKTHELYIPRHAVLNMLTARGILRDAQK